MTTRLYDIVLYGAPGFTGRFAAEHLIAFAPTDLKWAIAGRSGAKLEALATDLKRLDSDRKPPALEICSIDPQELNDLAKKTKILLTAVGPYAKYGTPVVEACVNNGTHYFDVTGETPWVYNIVHDYHEKARANKSIVIPQIGMDSAPADLLTWALVTHLKEAIGCTTAKVYFTLHKAKTGVSGGTLSSLLGLFDTFPLRKIQQTLKPWSLSPIPPNRSSPANETPGLVQILTGRKVVPGLGTLTTSLQGGVDRTQVYRSWGLMDRGDFYGPNFRFYPYITAKNFLQGLIVHLALAIGGLALLFSPMRRLARCFTYAPGQGPTREDSASDYLTYRAIAEADSTDPSIPKRAFASLHFKGGAYHITGVFLAEAGLSLLADDSLAKRLAGGVLTPATLGSAYIDRLQKAGIEFDVRTMP